MKTVSIQGRMQAVTPFHLAHANVKGKVDDNGRPVTVFASETPALPCTMTYRSPVVSSVGAKSGEASLEARVVKVPVMPGTNLRGHIRAGASALVKKALIAKGQQIDRPTYHALSVGATAGNGILRAPLSAAEILRARSDLFVGVFGGGPALFRSHLRTFDAYVACDEIRAMALIPDEANIADVFLPAANNVTFAQPFVRRDPMIQWLDPLARDVIENFDRAFMDWQSVVEATQAAKAGQRNARAAVRSAKKADDAIDEETKAVAATKTSKVMLVGHQAIEAVMPGAIFGFRVEVTGTDAQIGLVLHAIRDMFTENGFGGFIRNGFGLMAPNLVLIDQDSQRTPFLSGNGIAAPTVSEGVQPYLLATIEALNAYTAQDLAQAYLIERWTQESQKGADKDAA